ncbi:hypothetical protein ACM66B_001693 [Microbotryomycetes sp. NB124-2]
MPATPPRRLFGDSRWTSLALGSPWSTSDSSTSPRQRFSKKDVRDTEANTPSKARRRQPRAPSFAYAHAKAQRRQISRSFACKVIVVGLVTSLLLWTALFRSSDRRKLVIPKRQWQTMPYQHLDMSHNVTQEAETRVFHVAKEFGPATMGGLGVMLTALAASQLPASQLSVSVILPHYSFLRDGELASRTTHFAHIHVPITTSRNKTRLIGCDVSLLRWPVSPKLDFLSSKSSGTDQDSSAEHEVDIYLIGPGDEAPFQVAFQAKDAGDVYSAYRPLKQEWKDLFFARAVAEFVTTVNDQQGFVGSDSDADGLDVVHLHGATNAMVAYYLRQLQEKGSRDRMPAIVYTLHDSLDEVEYSNLVTNVQTFVAPGGDPLSNLAPYVLARQVFPSALGIDYADVVTFVSRSIAADIVEGRFEFNMQDLVMPSISRKAVQGDFIGVTNGLDFGDVTRNPWLSPELRELGVSFPNVGSSLLDGDMSEADANVHPSNDNEPENEEDLEDTDQTLTSSSFVQTKEQAKQLLVSRLPHLFSSDDLYRPILLFVGRFQYNKGCEFFEPVLELLAGDGDDPNVGARLVVMGARNNYPIKSLRQLQKRFPSHLTLIDDTTSVQRDYGTLIRMASDFAFVPSFSEAFGLVAAEGLLFGAEVISTGVGGLVEFLKPLPRDDGQSAAQRNPKGNARLFQLYEGVGPRDGSGTPGGQLSLRADQARPGRELLLPAFERCRNTVAEAVKAWRNRRDWSWSDRERWTRGLVADALALRWDRPSGPVEEYVRIYDRALARARARSSASSGSEGAVFGRARRDLDIGVAIKEQGGDDNIENTNPARDSPIALPIYKKWTNAGPAKPVKKRKARKKKSGGGKQRDAAQRHSKKQLRVGGP